MPTREIEEFAKILVREVRDPAIRGCDMNVRVDCQASTAKRWRNLGIGESGAVVAAVIPDCVDETLFFLLNAIDQGLLKLQFSAKDGAMIDLTREGLGELAGWYIGMGGFRSMYSEERVVDFTETGDERT